MGRSGRLRKILCVNICLAVFLSANLLPQRAAALSANDFRDVKNNWARPAINYVLWHGYMSGVSGTRFDPSGTVSRAQMAQVLYQRAGAPGADLSQNVFKDVKPEKWYAKAAVWCRENRIITGVKPDRFDPNSPVTREQICVMTWNFCSEYLGGTTAGASGEDMAGYTDWPRVSSWAREAVSWAKGSGFMNGTSDTKLTPAGKATREELAQFLYNLDTKVLGLDPDPGGETPPPNTSTVPLADKRGTKLLAHRGGGGTATENTLEAFTRSGERSYYGLECDVQRTKDGQYVIFHDSSLKRMTGMSGSVGDYTLKELQSLPLYETRIDNRVGGKNERLYIPTLQEYLEVCRTYKKQAVIEFTSKLTKPDVYNIIEIVRFEGCLDDAIFISFSMDQLIAARNRLPGQRLMLNCMKQDPSVYIPKLKEYHIDCSCEQQLVKRELIEALHENGLKLGCWTVNEEDTAKRMIFWGVDYIVTDILE